MTVNGKAIFSVFWLLVSHVRLPIVRCVILYCRLQHWLYKKGWHWAAKGLKTDLSLGGPRFASSLSLYMDMLKLNWSWLALRSSQVGVSCTLLSIQLGGAGVNPWWPWPLHRSSPSEDMLGGSDRKGCWSSEIPEKMDRFSWLDLHQAFVSCNQNNCHIKS